MNLSLRNKQILKLALPSIVSNITVPLLGLIDVAITGHLGSAAFIGAIAVGGMLFNIIYWLFAFLRMGTSGMTAQAFGRRDFTTLTRLLKQSIAVALGISAIMLILQNYIQDLALYFIAPEPSVEYYTRIYFNICVWGAPASLGLFALTGWYVGMQNTRIPMLVAIVQNVMNILASLIMVYTFGMQIEGVALGTVIAQWGGFFLALWLFRRNYHKRLRKYATVSLFTKAELIRFFTVNKDIFLRTVCLVFVHFFFITAGAKMGTIELAVNTVLMQFFTLYSYIMDGFAFAGEAIAGKAIGAGSKTIYDETIKRLFGWGTLMVILFTATYALLGPHFISILTDDSQVIQTAQDYHLWTLLFPICGLAAFIWDGIYIGATATRYMLLSMATGMVVFLGLYYILIPYWGNHGLWLAFVVYLTTRGIVQTITRNKICTFNS